MEFESLFVRQKHLLEELFPPGWFDVRRDGHLAYDRWQLCNELVGFRGGLPNPTSHAKLLGVASLLLDSILLIELTGGDRESMQLGSWQLYGDEGFRKFRESRTLDAGSFPHLLVELGYGAWHRMVGNAPKPLEEQGQADLIINVPGLNLPIVAECKQLASLSKNRINTEVKTANRQIKQVGGARYGVAIFNITAGLSALTPDGVKKELPDLRKKIRHAISGAKNRSVGAVVLIWDQLEIVPGKDGSAETLFHRATETIHHISAHEAIPRDVDLFDGYTVYSKLRWKPTI